jgi:MSHA biogenesis protein MshJ
VSARRLLEQILARLEALPQRQRVFVLLAACAVSYGVWDSLVLRGGDYERSKLETARTRLATEIPALEAKAAGLEATLGRDPDDPLREQLTSLEQELAALTERLEEQTAEFVPPEEMTELLTRLLEEQGGLELVRVAALAPQPIGAEDASGRPAPGGVVYRHRFVLELRGSWDGVLGYLRRVEDLPWHVFWERLAYDVVEHPEAHITLELHTLNTEEGWIGV